MVALKKGRIYILISKKMKHYTKEFSKILSIMVVGFTLVIAIIFIKYQPIYKVTINGEEVGYIKNKELFENDLQLQLETMKTGNVEFLSLEAVPTYEFKLLDRKQETNEKEIATYLADNALITYKYYEVIFNQQTKTYVDTLEEAEKVVNNIKKEYKKDLELDLQIAEKYTENIKDVKTESVKVAEKELSDVVEKKAKEEKIKKELQNKPSINGIKIAVKPVSGRITSRFGVNSRIRSSSHTGLDIACAKGTPIKAVNSGTVTFAGYNGSYGNLIKINHGNSIETWYAHCTKLYASKGEKVKAGEKIAAVGSTGNSTGAHLHLEIRKNGTPLNPQKYLYK